VSRAHTATFPQASSLFTYNMANRTPDKHKLHYSDFTKTSSNESNLGVQILAGQLSATRSISCI